EVLLHALAALRKDDVDVGLTIAGHGSHEPILRRLAAELLIEHRGRVLGTLAQEDLALLLRASDIFAIISTSETQSMVLLQAMASGIPVIAADSRALPEFVNPKNGVLVDPNDPARLARELRALLAAPERRRAMGAGGRRAAERDF